MKSKGPLVSQPSLATQLFLAGGVFYLLFLALKNSLPYPYTDNEGAFVLMGREMVKGAQLYADIWDHKPPFFFGQSWLLQLFIPLTEVNLHLYVLSVHILNAFLLFLLAKRLNFSPSGAWVAALAYAALLFPPLFEPWTATSDLLMQPFLLLSFWTAFSSHRKMAFLTGALWACAFLTKQSALFLLPVYLIAGLWLDIPRILRWAAGASIVVGLTSLYFALTGRWIDFSEALIGFNRFYVEAGWAFFWTNVPFRRFLFEMFNVGLLVYGIPLMTLIAGLFLEPRKGFHPRVKPFLLLWFLTALLSGCASGYFFTYYYVALLPPLALGAGSLWEKTRFGSLFIHAVLGSALVCFVMVFNWGSNWNKVFGYAQYPTQRYFADKGVGLSIAAHAKPGDELLAWTDDPQLYVYSGLKPSLKTPFINHLSYMPYTAMKTYQDFQQKYPRFVVLFLSDQVLAPPDWLKKGLKDHYQKVKKLGDLELYVLKVPT